MILALLVVLLAVVLLVRRRAARRRMEGGLTSERPVFSVEPPHRRMHARKDGRL